MYYAVKNKLIKQGYNTGQYFSGASNVSQTTEPFESSSYSSHCNNYRVVWMVFSLVLDLGKYYKAKQYLELQNRYLMFKRQLNVRPRQSDETKRSFDSHLEDNIPNIILRR